MTPLTLERSMEVGRMCQDILSREGLVHCVTVLSRNGRVIESRFRDDSTVKGLARGDLEVLHMQRVLQDAMSRELDSRLGRLHFTVQYREGLVEIAVPFYGGLVLVLCKTGLRLPEDAERISGAVRMFGSVWSDRPPQGAAGPILSQAPP